MASEVVLNVNAAPWSQNIQRLITSSKRDAKLVLNDEFKQVIKLTAEITPPGSEGVKGTAAKRQGEGAVVRDISSMYGTPRDAFKGIEIISQPKAKEFWSLQRRGKIEEAKAVMREAGINRAFAPFDGGAVHERMRKRNGRSKARNVVYFVTNPDALKAYIEEVKKRVFFLAAGWEEAAAKLGLVLPEMISRHEAPGALLIEFNDRTLRMRATNSVRYASQAADMQRRIQWVLDTRKDVLDRRWKAFVEDQAKKNKL